MSTAAISESPASATLLVVRPVAFTGGVTETPSPDNVVRMFGRGTQTGTPRRSKGAPGSTPGRTAGTVQSLDPESAARAVVGNMSCKVAQSALEIISGARSVQQLARWLDARCMSALTTRARLYAQACRAEDRHRSPEGQSDTVLLLHRQPRVHSVHCFAVSPGVFETAVVVADKTRFRAIAMRLELSKGMWKVTALRIG